MYYIDAWAWIEYLKGSKAGTEVKKYVETPETCLTSRMALFEVYSRMLRDAPEEEANKALWHITIGLKTLVQEIDEELMISAAKIKRSEKLGAGDAFALATARRHKSKLLTGDPDLKNFSETIYLGP